MKTLRLLGVAVLPVLLACGCSSMSNTDRGVLGGGAIGAGTGALIGNAADEREKKTEAAIAAAQAQQQIGLTDIVQMAQQHVSDPVIISQIRSSHSVYQLSAQDTIWLKQNGVSDAVITDMMATARYPRRVYTAAPVYGEPVLVVEPPPPVAVGVGVGFRG